MTAPLTIALANSGRKWIGEVAHVAMLYEQLEALGHRPWIICRRGFALHQHCERHGWRHLALRFHNRFYPWLDWADVREWTAWVRREQADVLHCHRGKDHWLGLAVAWRTGRPLVRTRHVMVPVKLHALNKALFLRWTDAIISVSSAVQQGFGPWQNQLPRGQVIRSAVDTVRFNPSRRSEAWRQSQPVAGAGEPSVWFGLVGRYQNIKGHAFFLEAAAQVAPRHPQARFFMAGAGTPSRLEKMRRRAEELGLGERVVVTGFVEDLPTMLASLDVGVIASIGSEGSSRIALEMMASGLPLVATRVGGIPELVEPTGAGEIVAPGDAGAMAQAMEHWLASAQVRSQAGGQGRAHVEASHQPHQWAAKMAAVYAQVLEARPSRSPA